MESINWKQLEKFINTLSEEQKERPVLILDNVHETIQEISDVDIAICDYYAHFEGVFSLHELEDEDDDFFEGVFAKIEGNDPMLIIN